MTREKESMYYADPGLSRWQEPCRLAVEAALDGFSFAVSDLSGLRLGAGRVPIAFPGSRQRLLERTVRFFETVQPFSALHFERVDLIRLDEEFTVVPRDFFEADKRNDLLSFSQGYPVRSEVLWRAVGSAVCIFPAEEELSSYFASRCRRVEQHHSMELFLQNACSNASAQGRSLHLNAAGGYLQTVVLQGREPVLANVFRLRRPADPVYYLTLAAARTKTDLSAADCVFYGDPQVYFDNRRQFERCVGRGRFRPAPRMPQLDFCAALDFVAYYDCYNVLNTRQS